MRSLFILLVLGMLALCIFGAFKTIIETHGVLTGIASLSWPEAPATITKWDVQISLGGSTKSTASRAVLVCEYRYTVAGNEYTNNRVASYPLSRDDIYRIGNSATAGSVQKVHYDPSNPKNSVLIKGWNCWALMVGLIFFSGTLAIIIALWKSRENIIELWKNWPWFNLPN